MTLVDEWPDLVNSPATALIAKSAHLADGWLAEQVKQARCKLAFLPSPSGRGVGGEGSLALPSPSGRGVGGEGSLATRPSPLTLIHGHCHQKALVGTGGTASLLKLIPGLDVRVLDTGCCGMAGSFGFETEHYDLSVQIAEQDLLPALASQPEATVIAPGTSCRHQIHDLAGRKALHPLELVAARL